MNLRNVLLFSSVVMVGFCLTLYFQTDNPTASMNFERYKNLQYHEARSHSLKDFNEKISPLKLEDLVAEVYERNKMLGEKTRVMELEFGDGRVLMELRKLFPDIELYGINREKTHTFYRRESFILTALKFNIMSKSEAEEASLPYVVFQDLDYGARIPYDENKFDIVFSQSAIPHIRYTFELFNEIMRVLKKGGVSVHAEMVGINIYSKGVIIPLKEAMKEVRKKGIEIYVLDNPQSVRFKKPDMNMLFPLTPHQPIPKNPDILTSEQLRPEMSYNINY